MNAYDEEYDRYEPDLKVWPFILLGFLVPLVPFICNIMLENAGIMKGSGLFYGILNYIVIAVAFFTAAGVVRTAKGSWVLALDGLIYFLIEMSFWAYYKINGFALAQVPFVIAIIPSFILLLSYAFFAKRSKLPAWGTSTIISLIFAAIFSAYIYMEFGIDSYQGILYFVFSLLLALLALFTFFVTKRSETTPFYINIVLIAFIVLSFFIEPSFNDIISNGTNAGEIAIHILKMIATSYRFWLLVSICFIYAGLAMKSCFKTLKRDDDVPASVEPLQEVSRYTPPANFQPSKERERDDYGYNPQREERPYQERQSYVDERAYQERRETTGYPQDRYDNRYDSYQNPPVRERYDARYDDRRYDDGYQNQPYDNRDRRDSYRYDDRPQYDDRNRDYYEPPKDSYRGRDDRPMLERDERRQSYNNDQYRSQYRDNKEDKWYDLLRGGIDDDEYNHRQDDDNLPRRR